MLASKIQGLYMQCKCMDERKRENEKPDRSGSKMHKQHDKGHASGMARGLTDSILTPASAS